MLDRYVAVQMSVALDKRSQVSLTFGIYIKPLTFLASIMISAYTVIVN